jgi:hypothetical protein
MADANQSKPREVKIRVHDGVEIAVALYMPQGEGPFPVVLAPSPYRYDNNALPATPQFLWRETGPIELYVARGYVYANMDIRVGGYTFEAANPRHEHEWEEWKRAKLPGDKVLLPGVIPWLALLFDSGISHETK